VTLGHFSQGSPSVPRPIYQVAKAAAEMPFSRQQNQQALDPAFIFDQ